MQLWLLFLSLYYFIVSVIWRLALPSGAHLSKSATKKHNHGVMINCLSGTSRYLPFDGSYGYLRSIWSIPDSPQQTSIFHNVFIISYIKLTSLYFLDGKLFYTNSFFLFSSKRIYYIYFFFMLLLLELFCHWKMNVG